MAARSLRILASQSHKTFLNSQLLSTSKPVFIVRFLTRNDSGAILCKPEQVRFGLIKIALIVTPFLLGGATISREFAAWLEEHELFVPDDDDDD